MQIILMLTSAFIHQTYSVGDKEVLLINCSVSESDSDSEVNNRDRICSVSGDNCQPLNVTISAALTFKVVKDTAICQPHNVAAFHMMDIHIGCQSLT